ncbi:flagellar hook-basal body protein [Frateuria sp. GZRe14]|uniref:flagellar hook-basal body protein n=1 Tax=Frateuria sp. GZRe14 TaxID=3351534 RepID=UPI003EDC2E48
MIDALYIAASGLQGSQTQIDTISNNMANMQTPGFKQSQVNFANVAALSPDQVQQGASTDGQGAGIEVLDTRAVFTEGALVQSGNPLDLAIQGQGFLEAIDATGNHVYTRAGRLHVDNEGYLATVGGNRLADGIQVPPDARSVTIGRDGRITALLGSDTEPTELGQIQLAMFASPEGLEQVDGNAFVPTEKSGDPTLGHPQDAGYGTIAQGMVEQSNVNMVQSMTSLVLAQRAYQLNARVLQAADEILDTINNLRR